MRERLREVQHPNLVVDIIFETDNRVCFDARPLGILIK
jgi:hypothetical protein